MKKQNIALLLFPISKIGGIFTVHQEMKKAFKDIGHNVDDYYLSMNKQRITAAKCPYNKEPYCEGRALGVLTNDFVDETIKVLNDYDTIVFSHPCPSKTVYGEHEAWMRVYREVKAKKVVIWHDPFWTRYYPWVTEVVEEVDLIACIQRKAYDSLEPNMKDIAYICNHPLDLADMKKYSKGKRDLVMSPHQFKSWKHIDKLVEAIPAIKEEIPKSIINLYNYGIEMYKMSGIKRDEKYFRDGVWIWDKAIDCGMKYRGNVTDKILTNHFKKHKVCVDLSVGELGNFKTKSGEDYRSVNYSLIESMKYGGLQVVRQHSVLEPMFRKRNFLMVDESCLVESVKENVIKGIVDFDEPEMMKKRKRNRMVLREHYDSKKIAKELLSKL